MRSIDNYWAALVGYRSVCWMFAFIIKRLFTRELWFVAPPSTEDWMKAFPTADIEVSSDEAFYEGCSRPCIKYYCAKGERAFLLIY